MTIRHTAAILVAAGAVSLGACEDNISDPVPFAGTASGGSGGAGGSAGSGNTGGADAAVVLQFPTQCEGTCCPTTAACYAGPNNGKEAGGECLATRNNTGEDHIQMRQAWIRTTTPRGNTDSFIYTVLSARSELPWPDCNQGRTTFGSGGYIQIIDFFLGGTDIEKHYSTIGYAAYTPPAKLQATLQDGFCFGEEDFPGDAAYRLPTSGMSPSADYPEGLPTPMGLADAPWHVAGTKAKRIIGDFDITSDATRRDFLKKLVPVTGDYGKDGFGGVFYYDKTTGYAHGYGRLGWTVVYAADGKTHISIPIREIETRSRFNDPAHPNCVGQYRADALDPGASPACSSVNPKDAPWGGGNCEDHVCDPANDEAPATIEGYFLISELEQIYTPDLQKTLCVSYPGVDAKDPKGLRSEAEAEGFYDPTAKSCRSPKWDPAKADGTGIPKGDWCAATNSAAHDNCHDAWHSKSLHVFVGGKIKVPADPTQPMATCPFNP